MLTSLLILLCVFFYFKFLCVGLFWLMKNNVLRCNFLTDMRIFWSTLFQGEIGEKGQKVNTMFIHKLLFT